MSFAETLLKCLIITEISIIGSFLMFSYDFPIEIGFLTWGGLLGVLLFLCWYWNGFKWDDKKNDFDKGSVLILFTMMFNGIMINCGGYLACMFYLRFKMNVPISIGGL